MKTCFLTFGHDIAPLVEAGTKPHTIRALRSGDRDPLPGDILHLYVGKGAKRERLIRLEACEYTHYLTIHQSAGNVHHVLLGGQLLEQDVIERLARFEGFADADQFVRHFDKAHGLPFSGLLIGWLPTPVFVTRH